MEAGRRLFLDPGFRDDLFDQVAHTIRHCTYELDKDFGAEFVTYAAGGLNPLSSRGRCTHVECNVSHALAFARTAALYSEKVVITDSFTHDLFYHVYQGETPPRGPDTFLADVQVLHTLRPLIEAGVVELGAAGYSLCSSHMTEIRSAERAVEASLVEALGKMAFSLSVQKVGSKTRGLLRFPELAQPGEREHQFNVEVPPRIEKRWRGLREAKPGSKAHRDVMELVRRAAKSAVAEYVADLLFETRAAALSRATVITDSRLGALGLQSLETSGMAPDTEGWERVRTVPLPWLKRLTAEELLVVRDEARDALPAFRTLLRSTIFTGSTQKERAQVDASVRDLRDAAMSLDVQLKRIAIPRRRRTTAALAAGTLGMVLYGLGVHEPGGVGTVVGAAGVLAGLMATAHGSSKEHNELVQRPAYVLLAAKRGLRHRRALHPERASRRFTSE